MLSWNTTPMSARRLSSVMSRRSWPSIGDAPADRVPQPLQQRHRGGLAGAGLADQRDRACPAARVKATSRQDARRRRDRRRTRPRTAPRRAARHSVARVRPSPAPSCSASSTSKNSSSAGSLKNSGETNDDGGLQPADQQHGEAHEADDLADARPCRAGAARCRATTMVMTASVLAARVMHVDQRPPVQHRELVLDHLAARCRRTAAPRPPAG